MSNIPKTTLSSGETIPLLGFGTAEWPFTSTGAVKESALHAIEIGYRHFDTAAVYNSEQPLGEAIEEALRRGFIKSREELFVTSKIWPADAHAHLVVSGLKNSLRNLGLEYLDLYLIHFPISMKPGTMYPFNPEDLLEMDYESVWRAMEECQNLGLTKSIGVSNFTCKKLQKLLHIAKIPPAVNQVEMHPVWQRKKLREFCEEKGIHTTAYSPLGAKGSPWGTNEVMDSPILKEIANARGKTLAQVSLRWVYEQGVSLVVKSYNKERMRENLDIFDWELSEEDIQKIDKIPQRRANSYHWYVTETGPYKSYEDVWDGEM